MHQRDRVDPPHALRKRAPGLRDGRAAGLQAQQRGDRLQVVLHPVVDLADRGVLGQQRLVAAAQVGDVAHQHERARRVAPRAAAAAPAPASTRRGPPPPCAASACPSSAPSMRAAISAASNGSATSARVSGGQRQPDEVAGVAHPVVGRERVGAGVGDEAQRVEPDEAVARARARVGADDRPRAAGRCRRRPSGTGPRRCRGRRSPAGWARGAWRGWRRGRAPRRPRRRGAPGSSPSAPAPPGASAAPRRGRSGPRRRPGAAAGRVLAATRMPTASSGCAVGPVVGRAWATQRKRVPGGRPRPSGTQSRKSANDMSASSCHSATTRCRCSTVPPGSSVCSASSSLSVDTSRPPPRRVVAHPTTCDR